MKGWIARNRSYPAENRVAENRVMIPVAGSRKSWIARNWGWVLPVAAVLGAVGAWLFFAVFAFHLVFVDDVVDEALPVFDSQLGDDDSAAQPVPATVKSESEGEDGEGGEGVTPTTQASNTAAEATVDDTGTADTPTTAAAVEDEGAVPTAGPDDEAPAPTAAPTTEAPDTTVPSEPVISVEASGSFRSRSHPTSGSATVLGDGTGQRFLRFEHFRTDNGPDLDVYLSSAGPDAPESAFDDDFVNLGDLHGNIGDQNYEIPRDLDLNHYSTVVVWCVRFSVAFGAAALAAA